MNELLFRYDVFKSSGGIYSWIANLLPKRIAYYTFIRVAGYGTSIPPNDTKHPDSVSIFDIMKAWSDK